MLMWNSFLRGVKRIFCKRQIWLISDTHFDHVNIIKYCHRPFHSVQEMNSTLVANWNSQVRRKDIVYFLGDWSFGRDSRPARYWRHRLNGHIISIKGGHDRPDWRMHYRKYTKLRYDGTTYLLVHDPTSHIAQNWHGWVIHGHKHNNNLSYPLINAGHKTINVSVELTDYSPLKIQDVIGRDKA